jgi:signal transduction histidine kinase
MISLFDTKVANGSKQFDSMPITRTRITDMQTCLQSLRSTYEVSLTIINRSSDFYRSAVGTALTPMKDIVDVKQVVKDSIQCMEAILFSRSKIHFEWNASPSDAVQKDILPAECDVAQLGSRWVRDSTLYLHTDAQWLRENLLCLISNAVKFSNDADVQLSVDIMVEEIRNKHNAVNVGNKPFQTYVRFGVIDKGLQMNDEELSALIRFRKLVLPEELD